MPFIYPYQANFIRKELGKLLQVVYFVGDYRVYQATKEALQSNIQSLFQTMTVSQAELFNGITEIKGQRELNEFMDSLQPYIIPFEFDANDIRRLFKKEKKLTLPDERELNPKSLTYLGWRDISKNQLFLVYPLLGEMVGIRARYTMGKAPEQNVCCICNEAMKGSEVGLVVAQTRSANYQSVGNYMCLDSHACNSQITTVDGIETFVAKALAR